MLPCAGVYIISNMGDIGQNRSNLLNLGGISPCICIRWKLFSRFYPICNIIFRYLFKMVCDPMLSFFDIHLLAICNDPAKNIEKPRLSEILGKSTFCTMYIYNTPKKRLLHWRFFGSGDLVTILRYFFSFWHFPEWLGVNHKCVHWFVTQCANYA